MCFSILGCMPNITRNAIVNCAELVTYDVIKELILKYDLMTGMKPTNPMLLLWLCVCSCCLTHLPSLDNLPAILLLHSELGSAPRLWRLQ